MCTLHSHRSAPHTRYTRYGVFRLSSLSPACRYGNKALGWAVIVAVRQDPCEPSLYLQTERPDGRVTLRGAIAYSNSYTYGGQCLVDRVGDATTKKKDLGKLLAWLVRMCCLFAGGTACYVCDVQSESDRRRHGRPLHHRRPRRAVHSAPRLLLRRPTASSPPPSATSSSTLT
ncbi:hypothetical protein BDV95DRAFT_129320 [Massariosphaeria phaeospora]|uniref:Uncharacterized protein n=1 Tax=Massariosphaeria phaeospora TaxID=100035 RepID=A0A7C8I3K8_9PLEO|nr:hypothetical protein BDV95DRAFT_129320 [Massariosphaeria phaeospora]